MVKFKGQSSLKQFMPNKPIKRGFKVWCRCDSHNGFTCSFQVYLGATDSAEKELGIRVTLDVCQDILNKGFHIYCDNFFACPQLAARLAKEKTYCIGTVRRNRKGFTKFNLRQLKAMKKGEDISNVEFIQIQELSTHQPSSEADTSHNDVDDTNSADEVSSTASDDEVGPSNSSIVVAPTSSVPTSSTSDDPPKFPVHCFCWRDKKHVLFVNNITHPWEVTTVARKQKDGTNKDYPCPLAVDLYNQYMGGVDMSDAMRRLYSVSRKSKKKWYMRLFWFLVDTCVVNAFILQCESPNHRPTRSIGKKKKKVYQTQLDFVVELGQQLVESHSSRKTVGRPPFMPPSESRFTKHVPCKYESVRACKLCSSVGKRKRTMYGCVECGVPLCMPDCYSAYHSR